ncbi:MAG: cupin domain-containing protein [Gammaproteobacteria bacterium]|nr:cupin domain-containing protein [Gammaproteobacteria bacterium]MBT8133381.1 cupin domain-containing protein [Gammaproteobacteria bacterium]NNJ49356.1 cupin domain-containing protein [Gammaproteobacteria bacterium]
MKPLIKKYRPDEEYFTEERCYITELSNSDYDPEVSIARARVRPGVTTRWHRLVGTTERYSIISGKGLIELDEHEPQEVKAGDTVLIPPMCGQRITNVGSEDLVFLAICTPRFTNEVYQDIDDISE